MTPRGGASSFFCERDNRTIFKCNAWIQQASLYGTGRHRTWRDVSTLYARVISFQKRINIIKTFVSTLCGRWPRILNNLVFKSNEQNNNKVHYFCLLFFSVEGLLLSMVLKTSTPQSANLCVRTFFLFVSIEKSPQTKQTVVQENTKKRIMMKISWTEK